MTSLRMKVVKAILRTQPRVLEDPVEYRRSRLSRAYPTPAALPESLQLSAYIQHERYGTAEAFTLQPQKQENASDWHIIYLPGGAYVEAMISAHWSIIEELLARTGASMTVPVYPLAPEYTHKAAQPLLLEVYQRVLKKAPAGRVVLMGDSAGGGLALAQAMRLRDLGLPLPARLFLISPWLDVTLSDPQSAAIEPEDPMLAAAGARIAGKWWAGDADVHSPLISPLYGDPTGLPPIDIFQGTSDILLPDVRRYTRQAKAAGAPVELHEYPGAIHVFPGATFTPEADDALTRMAQLLGRTGKAPPKQGLVRLLSSPPIKIFLYVTERRKQRSGDDGPSRRGGGLLTLAGVGLLLHLIRRSRSKNCIQSKN